MTMDNYFTDLPLAVNLLQNGLPLVGTLKKNKTFVSANFPPSSRREVYSSTCGFQRNMALMSYVPKKIRLCLFFKACTMSRIRKFAL